VSAGAATWTVLGAGAILPRAGYGCAGHVLRPGPDGPVTLFDCGPGTLRALPAAGLGLEDVRRVVLSHFHPDHCLDLLALAFARRHPRFEAPELELIGPAGLAGLLEGLAAAWRWVSFDDARVTEVDPRPEHEGELARDDLTLRWTATGHTPESLAWRADLARGGAVAYSGDTGEEPRVAGLARGVELLVAECSFPEEAADARHLTPRGAGRLAAAAGCGALLLAHFYPVMDPARAAREAAQEYGGPIETARDGSRHPFGAPD